MENGLKWGGRNQRRGKKLSKGGKKWKDMSSLWYERQRKERLKATLDDYSLELIKAKVERWERRSESGRRPRSVTLKKSRENQQGRTEQLLQTNTDIIMAIKVTGWRPELGSGRMNFFLKRKKVVETGNLSSFYNISKKNKIPEVSQPSQKGWSTSQIYKELQCLSVNWPALTFKHGHLRLTWSIRVAFCL